MTIYQLYLGKQLSSQPAAVLYVSLPQSSLNPKDYNNYLFKYKPEQTMLHRPQ